MLKPLYTLAISSFAVHGTASLKTFTTILGNRILPVPSLMLNGLTNMALVKKFDTPFKELLQGTFELAANRDIDLILYIGYLGKAEQADAILEMIDTYGSRIKTIITDPVCGDHGRKYVPDEVIGRWPQLIQRSQLVFPNLTEIKILTGNKPDAEAPAELYVEQFKKLYPQTQLVATSIKTAHDAIGVQLYSDEPYRYGLPLLPRSFGGTGDAFLALFILNHYYRHIPFNQALKTASDQVWQIIRNSIDQASDDLILDTPQPYQTT